MFHEPFKTIKTVRIPKIIWQRVPDYRAGEVERLNVLSRQRGTVRRFRLANRR